MFSNSFFFVRANLDYADIIYSKPLSKSFKKKVRMFQCNTALIITGAIKGTCNKIRFEIFSR